MAGYVPKNISKKSQLMAIFIIVAMVGSTIAFGLLSYNNSNTPPTNAEDVPPLQTTEQTTLKYSAKNIDSNVLQLLQSFEIFFDTNRTDIDNIDSEIRLVDGIKSLDSQFLNPQAGKNSLTYMAEISFEKTFEPSQLISEIGKKLNVSGIQAIRKGLVELPKTISLHSSDLNIDMDYSFKDNLSPAWLEISTIAGDSIQSELQVTLKGKDLLDILAFETKNLSSQFEPHSIVQKLKIDSMAPELSLEADYNYSLGIDSNALEEKIAKLQDVNAEAIDLAERIPELKLMAKISTGKNISKEDINSALSSLESVSLAEQNIPIIAIIDFSSGTNVSLLEKSIQQKLSVLGLNESEIEFQEPRVSLSGTISLNSGDSKNAVESIKKILFDEKISGFKLLQKAEFNVSILSDGDKNFALGENKLEVSLNPSHVAGEEIEIQVDFYTQRNKIVFLAGIKEKEA